MADVSGYSEDVPAPKAKVPEPTFTYAGANMGAEQVYECGVCGTLLRENRIMLHTGWHTSLGRDEDAAAEPADSGQQ